MELHPDLEKILTAIADLEKRIQSLKIAMTRNQDEIHILVSLEETLKENIDELKKNSVIASAVEFRKAKSDLKKTATRIMFLKMDLTTYEQALNGQNGMIDLLKRQYIDTEDKLKNNVLTGKFGKKDG